LQFEVFSSKLDGYDLLRGPGCCLCFLIYFASFLPARRDRYQSLRIKGKETNTRE